MFLIDSVASGNDSNEENITYSSSNYSCPLLSFINIAPSPSSPPCCSTTTLPKLPGFRAQRGYHCSYHPQWRRLHPNDPGSNPWERTTRLSAVVHPLYSLPFEGKYKLAYVDTWYNHCKHIYTKNKAMSADNTYHLIIHLLVFDTSCQVHPFIQVMLVTVYQTSRYGSYPLLPRFPAVRLIRLRDLSNGSGWVSWKSKTLKLTYGRYPTVTPQAHSPARNCFFCYSNESQ